MLALGRTFASVMLGMDGMGLQSLKRGAGRLAIAASNVYVAALLVLVALHRLLPEGPWWVRLAAYALPCLFLPLLAFLPLVLLSRSRSAKVLICVPCLLFVLLYGNLFVPNLASASPGNGDTLSVMTYNVTTGDPGVDEILAIIQDERPDVVALQELPQEVAEAAADLQEEYPYQALHATPNPYAGCGVLSRFPILEDQAFPLAEGGHLYQRVLLDVDGREVQLLNVHLQPPRLVGQLRGDSRLFVPVGVSTEVQDQELARLLEEFDGLKETVVVAGDFNLTDQSAGYRKLTARLVDAHREAGWGFGHTFPDEEVRSIPTPFPVVRIDYVFHSPDIRALTTYVGGRGGPNHRFLVAELSL
jgi:vancomycin resistance protein VanJ